MGDWIGTYVDSNEDDSTTFSDYTWKKIAGENGASGFKTASGIIFYQSGSATMPSTPSTSGVSYNFSTGAFTDLNSNWGKQTPEMEAGTASNAYWTSTFDVIE